MNIIQRIEAFLNEYLQQGVLILSVALNQSSYQEFLSFCTKIDDIEDASKLTHVRVVPVSSNVDIQPVHYVNVKRS